MLSLRLPSVRALSGLWRLVLPAPGPMPPALLLLVVVLLASPARSAPLATPLPLQQQLQAEFRKEGEARLAELRKSPETAMPSAAVTISRSFGAGT